MSRTILVISSVLAASLGGCAPDGAFVCSDDEACAGAGAGALCEANGWCSVEDGTCDGGRRYADHAGDGLGGICVGEEPETSDTSVPTTTMSSTTLDPTLDGPAESEASSEDTAPPVPEGWWDCGWAERRVLTITVPDVGEVLANVPVLVVLDASRIDPSIMAADGRDLRFVADDDVTVLSYDLELWAPEGLSWAWLSVPSLPPGETHVTMYYGNPAADAIDSSPVWSEYGGVWHMGFELADATGNNGIGLGAAAETPGQAGPGLRFSPPTDGVEVTASPALDGTFSMGGTVTAMIRPSGWGNDGQGLVIGRFSSPNGAGGWVFGMDGSREALRFGRGFTSGPTRIWTTPQASLTLNAWRHVAVVYQDDPLGAPTVYIDGMPQRLTLPGSMNGQPEPDDDPTLHIGGVPVEFSATFDGILDEVRVARLPRSAAWMIVEVASIRDELVSYGAPQSSLCD
jgi:biopolymer transport protein ExbB